MEYKLSEKIEVDLEPKAHKGDSSMHIKPILDLLNANPDRAYTSAEIISKIGSGGSVYGAIYRLAITEQIEFYGKKYHIMPSKTKGSFVVRSCGGRDALYITKSAYRDEPKPEPTPIPTTPTPIQRPLWASVEDMQVDELTNLIERAEKARFERMLSARYDGADFTIKEQVCEALRGYGIADPVALAHQKGEIGLLTATAIEGMPIVVTIGTDDQVKTIQCKHISLHGAPLVLALARAYRLASGEDR